MIQIQEVETLYGQGMEHLEVQISVEKVPSKHVVLKYIAHRIE